MHTHTLINNSEQQITMSTMEGSLSKWTNVVNGWQYRWFVLDDNAGLLSYYTSKEKMMRGARRGCVRLRGAIIGIDDEDDSTFTITTSSYKDDPKTFHFQTRNAEERERWIRALEDTILRHSHARWDPKKSPPKQDFDRKVAEADAYLQLLIDQIKLIETKQRSVATEDEEKQQKYTAILTQANAMLNSVKHTIVQLQIAKNTAIPVNGVYRGPTDSIHVSSSLSHVAVREPEATVQTGIELGSECVELRVPTLPNAVVDRDLPVPQFSYSSSDEDEDYYDAADEISPPAMQNHISIRRRDSERSHVDVSNENRKQNPLPPTKGDGSVDYDALYEEESETEMDSMESHGSVVTHLLSQVKIGMDLTKVALPTFILERRSLLEMYADYFTHPNQFVSIADMSTPKDRMVQVVRWYLCSFHAGRKSGVAKKPYNPILGEIFRCHWDIPNDAIDSSNDTKLVVGGPVPWCKENQLSFIAEQVSHHPPISAFYAEHYAKKISFGAHVWTKSKFLGLSIGVHNVGKGWVNVLQHGEEYVLTFPNGYGRSILTVPWIELGGTATIHCTQTGYHAAVEFLTKPFYGGKRNRITCQITQPGDKKPFVVINGEWSGAMEAKWSDGRTEIFADVKELYTQRKLVKPVCEQEEHESRKVWRDVTVGLRINDMEKATAAKCAIEQKQRDEARNRKENNINWQTKLFKETKDGSWVYVKPLADRLHSCSNQSATT
ncbi:oxysterol-binding protein-related protein 9 isoform X1 [Bombus vancouverensis nearcticus]|uniref:Oxysterol-binding protein n=1 Tax=Bombus bifarius TaxID=103933 RepID=A0A6P8M539_9HYME|nr:oxysterol-binding protein-related protein 9 isoform X1 [Bombus vancouverensis nearcticus]XP_033305474.1 oxysterol-binding protein-related protein 9 isoform X1 [Bombus bifarius]XP_050480280.1 oxysterol-binding protein-related protein 9 isoform X1 [Bombus huntii]